MDCRAGARFGKRSTISRSRGVRWRSEIADFLAPLSRDVWSLTYLDKRARLLEVLAADPALIHARHPHSGGTPLFHLPEDPDAAVDLATLLLAHGADTRITNKKGLTAEQNAREQGLIDAADVIRGDGE
jgi:hypothetical protein